MELTISDLVTALAERLEYAEAHDDLKAYFTQRLDLLCELFGCDLKRREKELDEQCRANRRSLESRDRDGSEESIEARYEVNGRLTMSFLGSCVRLMNRHLTPGGFFLEGMPPKIQRDVLKKYGSALHEQEGALKWTYRLMILDLMEYLFPGVGTKRFPAERLFEMGLPRERPDINDYF